MTDPPPPIPIPRREEPGGPQPIDDPPRRSGEDVPAAAYD